jgi:hypothetical protein
MSQTATLVKPWIHHTLVESLKNGMAVTVEQAGGVCQQPLDEDDNPATRGPLCVTLEQTDFFLLIHVHDQGGGVCQQRRKRRKQGKSIDVDSLFAFAQSRRKWDRLQDQQTCAMTRSPLQGLGVGLSLSCVMMRHLGGDLQLVDRLDPVSLSLHESVELEKGVTATIAWNQNLDFVEAGLWSDEWKHLEPADDSQPWVNTRASQCKEFDTHINLHFSKSSAADAYFYCSLTGRSAFVTATFDSRNLAMI